MVQFRRTTVRIDESEVAVPAAPNVDSLQPGQPYVHVASTTQELDGMQRCYLAIGG